jgi:phosphate starvation-inducible protein PhoH and related proteins
MGSDRAGKRLGRKLMKDQKSVRKNETLLRVTQEEHSRAHRKPSREQIKPLNAAQEDYMKAIFGHAVTFGVGPAGTGKTWLAAMLAAKAFDDGDIEKIIVTRPAVEAGESLGFLPGEENEKYEPYFRPVRDALEEYLGTGALEYHLKSGNIEARPLAYLRGATFKNCWVILDEAQNTTPSQMKMFLTRIGKNAKIIVNGDPRQKDIPGESGLVDALKRLKGLGGCAFVQFGSQDIVRSGMCQAIANRYENPEEAVSEPHPDRYNSIITVREADDLGLKRFLNCTPSENI